MISNNRLSIALLLVYLAFCQCANETINRLFNMEGRLTLNQP